MKVITIFFLTIVFLISLIAPAQAQSWSCRNDLEIRCNSDECTKSDGFTPMNISFEDSGSMQICAYTGCWEGFGTVLKSKNFAVVTGDDLPFSTNPTDKQDIVVAVDTKDNVGFVKVISFAHPFICKGKQ